MKSKLHPNFIQAPAQRHSEKPEKSCELIEAVSHEARVELFGSQPRFGWTVRGNEIDGEDLAADLAATG